MLKDTSHKTGSLVLVYKPEPIYVVWFVNKGSKLLNADLIIGYGWLALM
jgi:hypothetical protein